MSSHLPRRDVVRALPALAIVATFGGLGRLLTACLVDDPNTLLGRPRSTKRSAGLATDDDEYVPEKPGPVLDAIQGADQPPKVPNVSWEARANQLEAEQVRRYGRVFSTDPGGNGPMAGKERSHVPRVQVG